MSAEGTSSGTIAEGMREELALLRAKLAKAEQERDAALGELAEIKQCGLVYCPTCGSCGEEGCCHPDKCKLVGCLYGDHNLRSYRDMSRDLDAALAEVERLMNSVQLVPDAEQAYIDGLIQRTEKAEAEVERLRAMEKVLEEWRKELKRRMGIMYGGDWKTAKDVLDAIKRGEGPSKEGG